MSVHRIRGHGGDSMVSVWREANNHLVAAVRPDAEPRAAEADRLDPRVRGPEASRLGRPSPTDASQSPSSTSITS